MAGASDRSVRAQPDVERLERDFDELTTIGIALMAERNPEVLLRRILAEACRVTSADGGTIYLTERTGEGTPLLRAMEFRNESLPDLDPVELLLPVDDSSFAGYVAGRLEPVVLEDVYRIPPGYPFRFNSAAFDTRFGYRARSMLAVPMTDQRGGITGVLQLVNRKRKPGVAIRGEADADRWVLPFEDRDLRIVRSLASLAAVAVENSRLHEQVEALLEGFVRSAVTAIERRDPATAGHSLRVTELACGTARAMSESQEGPFAQTNFSERAIRELRYAGLVHDFGKVGVREALLVKARKLPESLEAGIRFRFALLRARGGDPEAIDRAEAVVREANEPRPLQPETRAGIEALTDPSSRVPSVGPTTPWVTPEEARYLCIPRGTLSEEERAEIERHAVLSHEIVSRIPWTGDFPRIREFVRGHHEKLDGSGYPDGLRAEQLPLETRILTVCDIFDALTAADRPYKKAVPVDRAFAILEEEARSGALDPEVVGFFRDSGVWRSVIGGPPTSVGPRTAGG